MSDFFDVVEPSLKTLRDDPSRGSPNILNPTTRPIDANEIGEEEIIKMSRDSLVPGVLLGDVDPKDIDVGRRGLEAAGIDILAFYKSFRFKDLNPFRGHWGIFLIDAGIAAVAAHFEDIKPSLPRGELQKLAVEVLILHEQYHFWIDAWALARELHPEGWSEAKKYEYYVEHKQQDAATLSDYEERLANHYLFHKLSKKRLSDGSFPTKLLSDFLNSCPVPYSDYRFRACERRRMEQKLARAILSGSCVTASVASSRILGQRTTYFDRMLGQEIEFSPRKHPIAENDACPTFVIRDLNFAARIAPYQAPDRSEFKRFVTSYLGGVLARKTDHEYFHIDNGEVIRFPNPHEKEIRGYELNNILLKAGMRRPDYWREKQTTQTWKKACPRASIRPPLNH